MKYIKFFAILPILAILCTACTPSSHENNCAEIISPADLNSQWDSDAVLIAAQKSINHEILDLTAKNIKGIFYNDSIGQITRRLNYGTSLADLWDGAYIQAVAFTDTVNKAFMPTRYYCATIETWLCYGDCEKLFSGKKIVQIIKGRNGLTMIRRKVED
ncbi:MAG: hypothetical protein JST26_15800 [Bacteroidetes bacterium]|nr:hypothetical protein [Bacteroidota bacterium]